MEQTPEAADLANRKRNTREQAKVLASIDEAFRRYRTPIDNQDVIRRLVDSVGAARLIGFSSYWRVERRGGGPALEVHAGYTNGFRSEEDITRRLGDIERWPSRRFHGAWGISHPVMPAAGGASSRPVTRRAPRTAAPTRPDKPEAICPTCFMVLPATGVCATCDS